MENKAFRLLVRSFATAVESSFASYAIVIIDEEDILKYAKLRKEFLAFKEKYSHAHEWTFFCTNSTFYCDTQVMKVPKDDPAHEYADDDGGVMFADLFIAASTTDEEGGKDEPDRIKLPLGFEVVGEPCRTELDMLVIDENGIQFSCFDRHGDDFSKTIEISYSFLFEGRL